MLDKSYFSVETVVANCSGTMEADTVSKHGWSSKSQMSRGKLILVFLVLQFFVCSAFGQNYTEPLHSSKINVSVDAYASYNYQKGSKVFLLCNDPDIYPDDLRNIEFEKLLKKLLAPQGYVFTESVDNADVVIFYQYSISAPQQYVHTSLVPVWGNTGVVSSQTHTKTTFSGKTYQETTYQQGYGVVGQQAVSNTVTTYIRSISFSAYDNNVYKSTGKNKMIWSVDLTSEGSTNDLRYVMPYMLAASENHIGTNTGKKITETIANDMADVRVIKLRNTLAFLRFDKKLKSKKNLGISKNEPHEVVIAEDVYKDGKIYIRKNTPIAFRWEYIKRSSMGENGYMKLFPLSTTDVNGREVKLDGKYELYGKYRSSVRPLGGIIGGFTCCVGFVLWTIPGGHAIIPVGTIYPVEVY